ncbi:adenylyltransferase/cytidyltransferase family protein [Microbulbifer marinus]|uniref:Glycerol-3-phosphate cytidylyltransferase n=1 Tax=Microbulbifer marinus TaxID=658218 RepID=A0A1H3VVA2_9GAMM|nr:glycerol-3-phosphate cytidylyltransferase [Microbulbifer marinus]
MDVTEQKVELHDFFKRVILSDGIIASYYRFYDVFRQVMERSGVEFFAHSGTMLGAVRHKGMIPWDDDLDVMVEEVFEEEFCKLIPELEKYGVTLKEKLCEHLYQFKCTNKKICPSGAYLQIDVFIGKREEIDGELCLHYKTPEFRKWFKKRYIRVCDLYPLRDYEFGSLKIKGIGDYRHYFSQSGFGLDEAIVARHNNFDHFKPEIEALEEQGDYPIRDPEILGYRHEIPEATVSHPLNYYAEGGAKTVITYGTFDLFHVGHVRILKRLRALGDRLVVGLSTDEFNAAKGKKSFYSYDERREILLSSGYVDEVFPENGWDQKRTDIKRTGAAVFGMGGDWRGKFDDLSNICEVVYLDRTEDISTTDIKKSLAGIKSTDIEGLEKSLHSALEIVRSLSQSV